MLIYTCDNVFLKPRGISMRYNRVALHSLAHRGNHSRHRTHTEVATKFPDSISSARTELEKLGVEQLLITNGTVTAVRDFYEESSFKGVVVVDTSSGSKLLQLFNMRTRRYGLKH